MKRVTMALFCPPVGQAGGVMHFRPAAVLAEVRLLFQDTRIHIHRNKDNCNPDFLKKCPAAVVDPQEYYFMTIALFKHGEEVELEVSGKNEELAAALVKTAFEHMDLDREELLPHLIRVAETIDDADRGAILAEARRKLSRPQESRPVVARLSCRLHGETVAILPQLARHLDCSVLLLYQISSGLIQQRRISAGDYGFMPDLLKDALDKGAPITIHASGRNREEALEVFRGVIENLEGIEYWIQKRGLNIHDPILVGEVLEIACSSTKENNTLPARPFDIHRLLDQNSVLLTDSPYSKNQAIRELAAVHAAHVSMPVDTIEESVWDREERFATLLSAGLAVPHAHLEGPEGVRLAMGIYKAGIDWSAGDQFRRAGNNTAYVVLMFLTGIDVKDEYVHYLAQVARLFQDTPSLVEQLRNAQSISQSLTVIRTAENQLSQA
jgi:mannitol/fructose-specific phosphotransferase system IIA component (Ntr-type)/phosphotransferase system HPr-like phosphotransfer protein